MGGRWGHAPQMSTPATWLPRTGLFPARRGQSQPWLRRPVSLQDSAGEPLYKLFKAIKHQVEKGPVDAVQKKAKYTLNDTGLLGDDVEYAPLVSPWGPVGDLGENWGRVQGPWRKALSVVTPRQLPPGCPGLLQVRGHMQAGDTPK